MNFKKELTGLMENIENIQKNIVETENQKESLPEQIDELRQKRQEILGDSGDAGEITRQIKVLQEEQEVLEDKLIGLKSRLFSLLNEGKIIDKKLIAVERIENIKKLQEVARRYNKKAKELAAIVGELYVIKEVLPGDIPVGTIPMSTATSNSWGSGALSFIQKFHIEGEKLDHLKSYYFSHGENNLDSDVKSTILKNREQIKSSMLLRTVDFDTLLKQFEQQEEADLELSEDRDNTIYWPELGVESNAPETQSQESPTITVNLANTLGNGDNSENQD